MEEDIRFGSGLYFEARYLPPSCEGVIVSGSILGRQVVVLQSHKAVMDLLDRRAALYSGRPQMIVASMLCGGLFLPAEGQTPRYVLILHPLGITTDT